MQKVLNDCDYRQWLSDMQPLCLSHPLPMSGTSTLNNANHDASDALRQEVLQALSELCVWDRLVQNVHTLIDSYVFILVY